MNLEAKIKKINTLKNQLDSRLTDQGPWDSEFLEKVKIDFTYASNNLEGNPITYGQTIQILKDFVARKDTSLGDFLDILNHKSVLDIVFENYTSTEISESNIKRLHKELMKNPAQWSSDIHYDPGKYKIFENRTYRSTGKEHIYAPPKEVSSAMNQLISETNRLLREVNIKDIDRHPIAIANRFHFQFLNHIHPFGDGNGRIARIFMNLILLQNGYPPIFVTKVDKSKYLNCFVEEEKTPGAMLDFMADQLIKSLKSKLENTPKRSPDLR